MNKGTVGTNEFKRLHALEKMQWVREGKAAVVFANDKNADSFNVAAMAPNTCFLTKVKYYNDTDDPISCSEVKEMFEQMEDAAMLEKLAECCRAKGSKSVTVHSVCLFLYSSNLPDLEVEANRLEWAWMLNFDFKFAHKTGERDRKEMDCRAFKIFIERHIAFAFEGESSFTSSSTPIGNLYPVMHLPLQHGGGNSNSNINSVDSDVHDEGIKRFKLS